MFQVYDMNTNETLHEFRHLWDARECASDMNEGHLDKLYGIRTVGDDEWCDSSRGSDRERFNCRQ